jgi:nucleotide-binding universal stress UspA family protein
MFAAVLVALSGQVDPRDALALGAQLARLDGTLLVAQVMATAAAPLAGGGAAAAARREHLRDAGEEVYATLGPDPRVRFVPLSGLPFAEAVAVLARREGADAIVVGQNLLANEPGAHALLASAPCPVAVAPYGHRFARSFEASRITVACGPPGQTDHAVRCAADLADELGADLRLIAQNVDAADQWLAHAQALAPAAATTRVAGLGLAAVVAHTRRDLDLLVTGGADAELLRQAGCPVLVIAQREHHPDAVAAPAWR